MEIKRSGSQPSAKGPAEWFTGTVRIDPLFDAPLPARANGASVTFEPGARTAWHTHPLGQTLIVTSGAGRAQRWGGPVEEIRPGDVIWIPPGEKHWHGAAPTTAMTHIAIQEKLDGKPVDWLEHVTAEQYEGRSSRVAQSEPGRSSREELDRSSPQASTIERPPRKRGKAAITQSREMSQTLTAIREAVRFLVDAIDQVGGYAVERGWAHLNLARRALVSSNRCSRQKATCVLSLAGLGCVCREHVCCKQ